MATSTMPTPDLFFDMVFSFQRTGAIKAAVDLDIFSTIGAGASTVPAIAAACQAPERGIRILCDFLTLSGLLTKNGDRYELTPVSTAFLTKTSPMYLGTVVNFLASREVMGNFEHLTDTIRRGSVSAEGNTVSGQEQELWVNFARAMMPMMMPPAMAIADTIQIASAGPVRVLDIAAGHGIFGIVLAQRNPSVEVVAVDWPGVLAVATDNAQKFGVANRHRTLPGDAFKVDYGAGFDIALVTNFLHHFDVPTCTSLMRKIGAALKPGGKAVILEFVPNDDRVTPPMAAGFALTMLAGTPAGDAYTVRELTRIAQDAGFTGGVTAHPTMGPQTIVVATR